MMDHDEMLLLYIVSVTLGGWLPEHTVALLPRFTPPF
jgi:hypothetical protein